MVENSHSFSLGLAVQPERLRLRGPVSPQKYTPFTSMTCSPSLHHHSSKENVSPQAGLQARSRVNWVKFNILVSIYQNWLRLEPFIRYWLNKQYEKGELEDRSLWPFLRRKKEHPSDASKLTMVNQGESGLFQQMRLRRQQLLKGLEPSSADLDNLSNARHLAKQMLSTLAIENTKWTKVRIQKQNRLFDEMINNFNEDQFQKNSEVIMHSIKERLFFIDQLQKKYLDYSKEQKTMLDRKIQMLKQPFKKVFQKAKGKAGMPEALFENLWKEIESQRSDVLKKKPQLRHTYKPRKNKQRYAILQKSDSEGLVIKYQIKHSDYYNESYLRSKQRSKTKKGKNLTKSSEGAEQSMQASIYGEPTKDSVGQQIGQNKSIDSNERLDLQQQEINNQFAEDFLRRQKQKQGYREQASNFMKKGATKPESYSHYRPSISYVDGRSNKDNEFVGMRSRASISRQRTSVFARRESRRKPTDEDDAEREDHMSRFKSHKKLITLKNIGGNRYTKLRDSSKKSDHSLEALARISGKLSKLQKKDFRKETLELRKAAHWKKAGNRKEVQQNTNEEEACSISQNHFLLSKQEFLAYFSKVLASGQLNQDRHQQLREKVKVMLRKHEPAAVEQTHSIVQKLVQKSIQNEYSSLMGRGRSKLLMDLYGVINKDECIRAKIREQMKIFFNEDVQEEPQEDESLGMEQFMYNTTELRKVNQQLKRIVCFKVEGDTLSFANRLVKEANSLKQCQI